MLLQIKPAHFNSYPTAGVLLQGSYLHHWLKQIQLLQIPIHSMDVYPIPGITANSVWGCFIATSDDVKNRDLGKGVRCQLVNSRLYIPQYASLHPQLSAVEMDKLLPSCKYILHPEFGLVALDAPITWTDIFERSKPGSIAITKPAETPFIPSTLQKVEIKTLPPEDVLQHMEDNIFPQQEKMDDKPLSMFEKLKFSILKLLLGGPGAGTGGSATSGTGKALPKWMETVGKWMDKIAPKENKWINKLQKNLEDLERRNQTEVEKLMNMFKDNPAEALKYAIPLDGDGITRGGNMEAFKLGKRWNNFSWLGGGGNRGGGGTAPFSDDTYQRLHDQYTKTVLELIRQQEYEKAAFVYMKLLKNHHMAAQTLEDGKMYPEAAAIFLKYAQNKKRAAECYEKGVMTTEAIGLYKELNHHEKVGDLYLTIRKKDEAFKHYNIVIDEYRNSDRYLKASLLYRNKMDDTTSAQHLLLEGWRQEKDAFNCLNNYFENIQDEKQLAHAIDDVYANETCKSNKPVFLTAIKHEHAKHETLAPRTKEIAYEIVSELAPENPAIVSELKSFNNDQALMKDVLRYKRNNK
ncbi:MAG: hypothetical protein V4722_15175 [Bacteroidota bacterium]